MRHAIKIPESKLIDPSDDRFVSRAQGFDGALALSDVLHVLPVISVLEVPEGVGGDTIGDRLAKVWQPFK